MDFSSNASQFGKGTDVDRQLAAVKQQLDIEFMTRKLQVRLIVMLFQFP
jgi:hypothetical protein